MHPPRPKVTTVDEYLRQFSGQTLAKLRELRQIIQKAAPDAEEAISYNIPAYRYHGFLVYFSGYTKHVSVSFPPHGIMEAFSEELKPYKPSKSTVQFPLDKPLPAGLVKKMVAFKMKENIELEKKKQ